LKAGFPLFYENSFARNKRILTTSLITLVFLERSADLKASRTDPSDFETSSVIIS